MGNQLVIVESPAKAKTIQKYLGKGTEVLASYGHVRDLLPKEGAVDPDNDFAMKYQIIDRNSKHVDAIARAMKKADTLYLATDPDREGEAISWHLLELLKKRGVLKNKTVHRVVFHEITKIAVNEAVANPREISMEMVNAQQARRALDYLVGFTLSPLLWKKIRRGLSAGRVQSPALRMIVERELEIEAFKPREYWSLTAKNEIDKKAFDARLTHYSGDKLSQFSVTNEKQSSEMVASLEKLADGRLLVSKVDKKQRKRNPSAPFTTSTLQQEASRKLGYGAQRTMSVAQQLYEGVDTGEGAVGLITYMRTDSVTLANEAVEEIRGYIEEKYGADSVPAKPQTYKTKSKNAQEAHEAVRPTSVLRTPDVMKAYLSSDQLKLYRLIWQRTVSCQMIHATLNTVAVDLACGPGNTFRATGSTIVHPGFMSVYQEGKDDSKSDKDEKLLPPMEAGDVVSLTALQPEQHFTEPPPRFSEASLIRSLEEYDIGRPSTYANIISTLINREYVELEKKRFYPTDVGRVVGKFLVNHFTKYVDYDFTANLEGELDAIARGEKEWIPLLTEFWAPFKLQVETKDKEVQRSDVTQEDIGEDCPKCSKPLSSRLGRSGRFIGCTAYPECDYTRNINGEETTASEPEVVADRKCPKCESDLWVRTGKYGKFIGCSSYPKCKHIESLEQPEKTGVDCPDCKKGEILLRKSRRGKVFYSCERYPDCSYAIWNLPVKEACPDCEWPILSIKTTKSRGTEKVCPQKGCGYTVKMEDEAKTE